MKILVFLLAIVMVFSVMTYVHASEDHQQPLPSISRLLHLLLRSQHQNMYSNLISDTDQGQHERTCKRKKKL